MNIQESLVEVMREISHVGKKERNQAQGFNFRGIDAVVNAVGPALRKHSVVVAPTILSADYSTVEVGKNRTPMREATLLVKYTFYGVDGDSLEAVAPGEALDSGDKATAKAMSVAFRTCLLQTLALPTDDKDPDADSYERAAAEPFLTEKPEPKKEPIQADTLKRCTSLALKLDEVRGEEWSIYREKHPKYKETQKDVEAAEKFLKALIQEQELELKSSAGVE